MSTSVRKQEANRRNALKSTGPKTPEGKARSSMNAVKHGLLTAEILVKGERMDEFVSFRKKLTAALRPIGELEMLLAERVVSCAWRLRRCVRVEAEIFDRKVEEIYSILGTGGVGLAFIRDGNGSGSFATLIRYESGIERSLFKALHELQRIQAQRAGQAVPLPAALDVDLTVSGPRRNELDEAEEVAFGEA